MINKLKADNIIDLQTAIYQIQFPQNQLHFRGQSCIEFELQTRIAAHFKDSSLIKTKASEIINRFKTYVVKYNLTDKLFINRQKSRRYFDEYYWLFQAQHIGIPTIFMDWSFSWKQALYFAIEDEKKINCSGQLWVLNWATTIMFVDPDPLDDFYENHSPYSIGKYGLLNPNYDIDQKSTTFIPERNRFNQAGEFFVVPFDDNFTPLEKRRQLIPQLTLFEITSNLKKEVHYRMKNNDLTKTFIENDFEYEKYEKGFIYGKIDNMLFEIVNQIRLEFGFDELSK